MAGWRAARRTRQHWPPVSARSSIRAARRLMAAPGLARFAPVETLPGPALQSAGELAEAAGRIATTIFHPVGTARMGPAGDREAVTDPRLSVRGMDNLMIADASVMPTIVGANTNAATVMIGEKAADLILGRRLAPAAATEILPASGVPA